jgi:hypothetical protein
MAANQHPTIRARKGASLHRFFAVLLVLPVLLLTVGCDDDDLEVELEAFVGSWQFSGFSNLGPAVSLDDGIFEISDLQASRGVATGRLSVEDGRWAGNTFRIQANSGSQVFVDTDGAMLFQGTGTAVLGSGAQAPYEITLEGARSDGEIQGTISRLYIEGLGTTEGEFTAIRTD